MLSARVQGVKEKWRAVEGKMYSNMRTGVTGYSASEVFILFIAFKSILL